jgi:gliding motility-associated-like protein
LGLEGYYITLEPKAYKLKPKVITLALFFMLSFSTIEATHIVGGEMNYTCLGNNEYEITLTLFRDCFYGNPNAWFDNPASIGVFDVNNLLLEEIQIPLIINDTLVPTLSGDCFVVPPDVCVHTTTYTAIVTLPPIIGGYQLAYQRCCRNQTIANIIDPLGTGATYGLTISEQALIECNTSPKFQQWPPLYICVNEPIVFDQSAIDVDGDSIVYTLCAPLKGADPNVPQPQPPNPPPYDPVDWVDPPYGVNNMLNGIPGGAPLQIDSETGLLTGLPNTVGQFVVGICIEEYRDGLLISTTRRDFQYNVGVCGQWVASFFTPEVQCEGFEVTFDNMSYGTDEFLWDFGDPNNPGFVSTDAIPTYTYSDTGLYLVTLIAGPDNPCVDTFQQEVYLQYNTLTPDFSFEYGACTDSLAIQVNDLSMDSLFDITDWYWEFLPDEDQTSTDQNPVFYATNTGVYTIQLTIIAENGCEKTIAQAFFVDLLEEELTADTIFLCQGEQAALNSAFDPEYNYLWSPAEDFIDPTQPDPVVVPLETTNYTVIISDAEGYCEIERSITVVVPIPLEIDVPPDLITCEQDIFLGATSPGALSYQWGTDVNFSEVISEDSTVVVTPFGLTTYYVRAFDENGCGTIDSVVIEGNGVNLVNPDTLVACEGEIPLVWINSLDPNDILSVEWSPVDQILTSPNELTIFVQPDNVGPTTFYVTAENQFGCMDMDSVTLYMIDTTSQADFVSSMQCSGYSFQFSSTSINAPYFIWYFDDPGAPPGQTATGANVEYTFSGPGVYDVTITLPEALNCQTSIPFQVTVEEPDILVDFSWEFIACVDTALIQFTDLSTNNQSTITDWSWSFSNGDNSELQHPQSEFYSSQEWEVTLAIVSSDGCIDSITLPVDIALVEETLQDSVLVCPGDSIQLNPEVLGDYEYFWTPIDGLSSQESSNPWASPSETTTYSTVISSLVNICSIEQAITVTVPPPIEYELAQDTAFCDDSYLLYADSEQAISYAWSSIPDFSLLFSEEQEVLVPIGELESSFFIQMTDEFGCTVEDVVNVQGYGISVSLEDMVTLCIGDTIQLEVVNLLGEDLIYSWSPLDYIVEGATTSTPIVNPGETTVFNVALENNFGCTLDTFIQVNIFNFTPPLEVFAEPDSIVLGESSELGATLDDTYTYLWSPPETLDNYQASDPIANPFETTTYGVEIRDENGCINQAFITVFVLVLECGEPYIFIPTGFTPDDDGLNDELEVYGNNINEMHLVIYDRWGELVFESYAQSETWDGIYKGKELPPGVFGFYLEVQCDDGETFIKKGNITLIR